MTAFCGGSDAQAGIQRVPAPEQHSCLQVFKKVGAVAVRLLLIPGIVEAAPIAPLPDLIAIRENGRLSVYPDLAHPWCQM